MLNQDKFKTAEERVRAFGEFCKNEFCNQCNHLDCKLHKQGSAILRCYDGWLALEAEYEKPEPCFYCSNKTHIDHSNHDDYSALCYNCGYRSKVFNTREEAIAAHNRVARAVRAAESKKGE